MNNNNSDDEDSNDVSIDSVQIRPDFDNSDIEQTQTKVITISSNKIKDKQENDIEVCKCGDPSLHKNECSIFCGLHPCEDELVKLPKCDHFIHNNCLQSLLYVRLSKCPLCRASIDSLRKHTHYKQIGDEISEQFRSDTEQAILLSQKMAEEEQKRKRIGSRSRETNQASESERERSRSRERESSHNRDGNRNNNGRRVRFRPIFHQIIRNRSRNRNRNGTNFNGRN